MNYSHVPTLSCFYSDEDTNSLFKNSLFAPEAHFEYEMILVTGGNATMIINHRNYDLQERSLVFISRLERHSFMIQQTPYKRFLVTMSGEFIMSNIMDVELVSVFLQRPKGFQHVINLSDETYHQMLPLFETMTREYESQQPFYMSYISSILSTILINLFRTNSDAFPAPHYKNISKTVLSAQRYINDHFDQKISLQEIADQNFVCAHSLSVAFKGIVGMPFREYLVQFRITEAKKLLLSTELSVGEIAEQVGYVNVNNFIRIFKSKESMTPLQYRNHFHMLQK